MQLPPTKQTQSYEASGGFLPTRLISSLMGPTLMLSTGRVPWPHQDQPREYGAVGLHRHCWPPGLLVLAQLPLGDLWGTEGNQANGYGDGSCSQQPFSGRATQLLLVTPVVGENPRCSKERKQLGTACNHEDNLCSLKPDPQGPKRKDRPGSGQTSDPGKFHSALGRLTIFL